MHLSPINSCSYEINDLQEIELIPIGIHQQFLQRSLGREIIFHARLQWMHEDWWAASEVCYCAQRAVWKPRNLKRKRCSGELRNLIFSSKLNHALNAISTISAHYVKRYKGHVSLCPQTIWIPNRKCIMPIMPLPPFLLPSPVFVFCAFRIFLS